MELGTQTATLSLSEIPRVAERRGRLIASTMK
jgi:hypothetical protein